jgi:hypothetical protein
VSTWHKLRLPPPGRINTKPWSGLSEIIADDAAKPPVLKD